MVSVCAARRNAIEASRTTLYQRCVTSQIRMYCSPSCRGDNHFVETAVPGSYRSVRVGVGGSLRHLAPSKGPIHRVAKLIGGLVLLPRLLYIDLCLRLIHQVDLTAFLLVVRLLRWLQ
jgi:hypothetical protein